MEREKRGKKEEKWKESWNGAADWLRPALVALQIFEQYCAKARNANSLVFETETNFYAKWPFKVIQGHLFRCQ